jgi:hypothetical protein
MNKEMLFRVLAAANFMEIPPLLDLACLWCTFQISGKSPEEVIELVLPFFVIWFGTLSLNSYFGSIDLLARTRRYDSC